MDCQGEIQIRNIKTTTLDGRWCQKLRHHSSKLPSVWVISSNYSVLLISCLSGSVGRSSSASVIHRNLSILSVRRNLPTNSILTLRPFVSFRCCQRRKVCQHPLSSVNGSAASSLGVLFSWCCSELNVEQILTIKPGSTLMFMLCLHVQLREVQQNLGCCFDSSGALGGSS